MAQDQLEQCAQILAGAFKAHVCPTGAAGGVHRGEIQLVIRRAEVGKEVKAFVQRAVRLAVCLVDLVDDNDRTQAQF